MGTRPYPKEFKSDAVALYLSDPGKTYAAVGRDLGVHPETLRLWVRQARAAGTAGGPVGSDGRPSAGKADRTVSSPSVLEQENKQLKARIAELEVEREILRRAAKYFAGRDEMVSRFQFVADHRDAFGVKRLCRVLQVSRSGFYRWISAAPGRVAREAADAGLAARIRAIHREWDSTYGSPRITAELNDRAAEQGEPPVNRKRVERVMRKYGIAGLRLRKKVRTTLPEPSRQKVPDLLRRDFTAAGPNQKYVGDITYLPIAEGRFLYLASVIDLFSRRLAGWSIADHMCADLVVDALRAAATTRGGNLAGAILHTDHGAQYCSEQFAAVCAELGVIQSRGAVGSSADNAVAEAWNGSLKRETLQGADRFASARDARLEVFRWITRYNTIRRHSSLGQTSPITYEQQTASKVPLAA
ncbi:IS3 family transposase [Nocardia sp. NPDC004260]